MEDNEMMVNEEIVETTAKSGFKTALRIGGIATGIVLVGYGLYRGGKWVARKIKERKEQEELVENQEDRLTCH